GQAFGAPYSATWTNNASGLYTLTAVATDNGGTAASSSEVSVTARRVPAIAYVVDAGTVGGQAVSAGLGMDFDVLTNIAVTHLGVFDSGGDGVNGSALLTVQLFSRSGNAGTVLATTTFTVADPGALIGGSRFKPLTSP